MSVKKSKILVSTATPYLITLYILITVFAFSLLFSVYSTQYRNEQIYCREIAEKTASQIDSFLGEMDTIALRTRSDSNIVMAFHDLTVLEKEYNSLKRNIPLNIELATVLATVNRPKPVWRISVYDTRENFVSTGAQTDSSLTEKNLENMNVALMLNELRRSGFLIDIEKDNWANYFDSEYISIYRPVMNEYSNKIYAVVQIQQDIKELKNLVDFSSDRLECVIKDINGKMIYSSSKTPKNAEPTYIVSSSRYGWSVNIYSLWKPHKLFILFFVLYILIMLLITKIVYAIADRVTKPLRQLQKSVSNISGDNTSIGSVEGEFDELKALSDTFSDALERVTVSAAAERKAITLAMQSQMNPHFLFNTLAVMSSKGMECGNDDIVQMCRKLSDMMRYVAGYEKYIVPMHEEIEYTKNYLELMKSRYEDSFEYDIKMDSMIENVLIPKLVLQPLAENCFAHGFKGREPTWHISIRGECEKDKWYLTVEDNGTGFDKDSLDKIHKKIAELRSDIKNGFSSLSIGGIGVAGTICRLELMNKEVSYEITSDENHTKVVIICKI